MSKYSYDYYKLATSKPAEQSAGRASKNDAAASSKLTTKSHNYAVSSNSTYSSANSSSVDHAACAKPSAPTLSMSKSNSNAAASAHELKERTSTTTFCVQSPKKTDSAATLVPDYSRYVEKVENLPDNKHSKPLKESLHACQSKTPQTTTVIEKKSSEESFKPYRPCSIRGALQEISDTVKENYKQIRVLRLEIGSVMETVQMVKRNPEISQRLNLDDNIPFTFLQNIAFNYEQDLIRFHQKISSVARALNHLEVPDNITPEQVRDSFDEINDSLLCLVERIDELHRKVEKQKQLYTFLYKYRPRATAPKNPRDTEIEVVEVLPSNYRGTSGLYGQHYAAERDTSITGILKKTTPMRLTKRKTNRDQ